MCGIVGVIKPKTTDVRLEATLRDTFKDLLLMDELRGMDATGIYGFLHEPATVKGKEIPAYFHKRAVPAHDFLQDKVFQRFMTNFDDYKFLVGHNRFATMSRRDIDDKNAHPFVQGNVLLVHNGTLSSIYDLEDRDHKFAVDSEAIAYSINTRGIEETVNRMYGTYTLVWGDLSTGQLNIIRNTGRPLAMGILYGKQGIVFASEQPMLYAAARRNNLNIKAFVEPKPLQLIQIDPNSSPEICKVTQLEVKRKWVGNSQYSSMSDHWKEVSKNVAAKKKKQKKTAVVSTAKTSKQRKIEERLKKYGFLYGQHIEFYYTNFTRYKKKSSVGDIMGAFNGCESSDPYRWIICPRVPKQILQDIGDDTLKYAIFSGPVVSLIEGQREEDVQFIVDWKQTQIVKKETVNLSAISQDDNEKPEDMELAEREVWLNELYIGPNGVSVNKEEFENAVKHGCCVCSEVIELIDHMDIGWTSYEEPLCHTCVRNEANADMIVYAPKHKDS